MSKKSIELRTAELLLALRLAKTGLDADLCFEIQVDEHEIKFNRSPNYAGLHIDDWQIAGMKEDMTIIVSTLIELCKNPVDSVCAFSTTHYKFSFKSWRKTIMPEVLNPEMQTGSYNTLISERYHPSIELIPTVSLTVEEVNDEDSDSD